MVDDCDRRLGDVGRVLETNEARDAYPLGVRGSSVAVSAPIAKWFHPSVSSRRRRSFSGSRGVTVKNRR